MQCGDETASSQNQIRQEGGVQSNQLYGVLNRRWYDHLREDGSKRSPGHTKTLDSQALLISWTDITSLQLDVACWDYGLHVSFDLLETFRQSQIPQSMKALPAYV